MDSYITLLFLFMFELFSKLVGSSNLANVDPKYYPLKQPFWFNLDLESPFRSAPDTPPSMQSRFVKLVIYSN